MIYSYIYSYNKIIKKINKATTQNILLKRECPTEKQISGEKNFKLGKMTIKALRQ